MFSNNTNRGVLTIVYTIAFLQNSYEPNKSNLSFLHAPVYTFTLFSTYTLTSLLFSYCFVYLNLISPISYKLLTVGECILTMSNTTYTISIMLKILHGSLTHSSL